MMRKRLRRYYLPPELQAAIRARRDRTAGATSGQVIVAALREAFAEEIADAEAEIEVREALKNPE